MYVAWLRVALVLLLLPSVSTLALSWVYVSQEGGSSRSLFCALACLCVHKNVEG